MNALLQVRDLVTSLRSAEGRVRPVDGISFELRPGECVGLVGESGCGKSMTALSMLRLLPSVAQIESGQVIFDGRDLAACSEAEMNALRGRAIAMVFQESSSALNPVYRVGWHIAEALRLHGSWSASKARARAIELLTQVGIAAPETRVDAYPHELSGGMRQRVMIALALACRPKLLLADEPTTALDVTVQAQVLGILRDLQQRLSMSVLLVTHNLGVVAHYTDRVMVMYAGKIVEEADTATLFSRPRHPYTQGLLASLPSRNVCRGEALTTIPGVVPPLDALPQGCRFQDRCLHAHAACREVEPLLEDIGNGQKVACIYPPARS